MYKNDKLNYNFFNENRKHKNKNYITVTNNNYKST